jgi:hypothetical protein
LKQIHFALELHGIAAKREISNAFTYNNTISYYDIIRISPARHPESGVAA